MALASQSGRSTSRRSYMSSRRRSRRSRWILGILLIAIACVVGWWFTSESKTAIDPESSTAGDTEVSAPTENVASSSDSQIYFDDGRRAPNEAAKTTGTAEPDRTERPDPAKPTAAVNSTKGTDDSSKTAEPNWTACASTWMLASFQLMKAPSFQMYWVSPILATVVVFEGCC